MIDMFMSPINQWEGRNLMQLWLYRCWNDYIMIDMIISPIHQWEGRNLMQLELYSVNALLQSFRENARDVNKPTMS